MLLRRFTEHVRDQDWFAVGLDFLVVVVGIYVGLQADEWNEQRKDRIREQAHLEQLYSDFAFNAELRLYIGQILGKQGSPTI